jgi:hypothetical protein
MKRLVKRITTEAFIESKGDEDEDLDGIEEEDGDELEESEETESDSTPTRRRHR